jgi:hypothetical protein
VGGFPKGESSEGYSKVKDRETRNEGSESRAAASFDGDRVRTQCRIQPNDE